MSETLTSPSTAERRARLAADKLAIAGPGNAATGMTQGADFNGSNMILPVMSVKCYDKNPRQSINPRFQEIKNGIRERRKLPGSLAVTKRPGERDYMLYMGGNTRLLAVQELWQETNDPAFHEIAVTYYEWISEADVISAHLIENEARGDTTFWDKATGLLTLKQTLEQENNCILSSSVLEEHTRKLGMSTTSWTIQNYLFATRYLAPIGSALRLEDVKLLKPRINSHRQLAQQLQLNQQVYDQILNNELEQCAADIRQGVALNATTLCNSLDQKLGQAIDATAEEVRLMMMALSADRHLAGDALRVAARSVPQDASASPIPPAKGVRLSATRKRKSDAISVEHKRDVATDSPTSMERPSDGDATSDAKTAAPAGIEEAVRNVVSQLCDAAHVRDCLRFQPDLPLGFFMEMPEALIEDTDAADPNIRRACWLLLATLTGQFNPRICAHLPSDSRWREAMQLDAIGERSFETEYQVYVQGICSETGEPGMRSSDLSLSLLHPVAGPLLAQLLHLAHQWRSADPKRLSV